MRPDPLGELRAAARELADIGDPVAVAVAAWLDGVAERMAAGGWVLPPERNHALKVARAALRPTTSPPEPGAR